MKTCMALISMVVAFSSLANAGDSVPSAKPALWSDPPRLSVILTAFGDSEATYGETQPFLRVLTGRVERTADSTFCMGLYEGQLFGQPVVVVSTGTGGDNSGPCMQEVLQLYGRQIREVIWSGIAGASPAIGGMVDVRTGRLKAQVKPVMIGDVCISPLVWNYDLHFSSVADWKAEVETSHNPLSTAGWHPMKDSSDRAQVIGFENTQQAVIADKALADELLRATRQVEWPPLDAGVRNIVRRFFPHHALRPVRVFNYTQCSEVTANNFWHGVVEDRLARQYLADLINASSYAPDKRTEHDVVAFSAMEGVAWASVVQRWAAKLDAPISLAIVRAASNYSHMPLDDKGRPKLGPNGKPMTAMDDILLGLQGSGPAFAVHTAALPILKMFELRQRR